MSNKQKPDGWVAWHPKDGADFSTTSISKQRCEDRLIEIWYGFAGMQSYAKTELYFILRESFRNMADRDGWRIRPVKITLLDEGE